MSAVTVSLCSTLLFVGIVIFVSAEEKIITVESGKNVTLPCRAPKNSIVVKWSRADLEPEYVLFYRDEQFDPQEQHHSFVNRVDLQDRQMKDGDVSLILKDVKINDTGKYMSHVVQGVREPMRLISIINLRVVPPGQTGGEDEDGGKEDGYVGLICFWLGFAIPLVIIPFGFLMCRKGEQTKSENSYKPPPEL